MINRYVIQNLQVLVVVIAAVGLASEVKTKDSSDNHAKPHWTYAGESGPENWGRLSPEFATCSSGGEQSPVDLRWAKPSKDRKIEFKYGSSSLRVINNGHTIQANFDAGSKVEIEGHAYDLVQVHFHSKSEHLFSGKSFPLEAHFVHKDSEGKLAVVGVMIQEGEKNDFIGKVWANIPHETGKEVKAEGVTVEPIAFLPRQKTHYHYMGSLTTPPCTEGVNWNVLNTTVEASRAQIEQFRSFYANNARPVQKLNSRKPANF